MTYRTLPLAIAASLLVTTASSAQQPQPGAGEAPFVPVAGSQLQWNPIQPPGFDPGMEIAVVRGDPTVAAQPYVIRLRFPDGYRFPPHYHPVAENVTVLDGEFLLAMGDTANEAQLRSYQPGDYLFIEARHPHFGGARGQTVIQLHGMGPFEIITVGTPQDRR